MQLSQETIEAPSISDNRGSLNHEAQINEFLIFRLGEENYAMDILCVQEIRSYADVTRIANAPAFIKGVVNLRGIIVPIFDLRIKFELEVVNYDSQTVVIVVNIGRRVVGVVVDAVKDVLPLDRSLIRPVPELSAAAESDFITGFGSVSDGSEESMVIIVDMARLVESVDSAFSLSESVE